MDGSQPLLPATENAVHAAWSRRHRRALAHPSPLARTARARKWGPGWSGRGNESDLRGTLPTIPSAWLLVVSGTAVTGYRCRLRVGMPQPLCVAPRQLKKTHLASTALKSGSHGWTASCRDNERTCTKYFLTKASGDWDLAQLKCSENKNRWHVMPDFDPYWEDMDTLRCNP